MRKDGISLLHGIPVRLSTGIALPAAMLILACVHTYSQQSTGLHSADTLIALDRELCRAAEIIGSRNAFFQAHSDDGIRLSRQSMVTRNRVNNDIIDPTQRTWKTSYAELSASGTMGYTTGSLLYGEHATRTLTDEYLFIWKRGFDGGYKIVLSADVSRRGAMETSAALDLSERMKPEQHLVPVSAAKRRPDPGRTIKAYQEALTTGTAQSRATFLAPRFRILRTGLPPIRMTRELSQLDPAESTFTYQLLGTDVEPGSLAYEYGSVIDQTTDTKFFYVRIWRCENGRWKLAVDLLTL